MQISANQWASAISAQLATPPAIELILTKEYNLDTRELTVTVSGIATQPVAGDIRLSVMLTESGIIDAQDDFEAGGIVPDYYHKHVLRTMMTPATGAPILSSVTTGQTFTQTFILTLDPAWNAGNMEIIAFISNVQGASVPVLQAASLHVTD